MAIVAIGAIGKSSEFPKIIKIGASLFVMSRDHHLNLINLVFFFMTDNQTTTKRTLDVVRRTDCEF